MSLETEGKQDSRLLSLAANLTGTGPQTAADVRGLDGTQEVEVVAVGTIAAQAVTFTFEGSMDNTNFYQAGYSRIDAQATVTRAVGSTTLTPGAGTIREVFTINDKYRYLRINVSANTLSGGGAGITANLFAEPI